MFFIFNNKVCRLTQEGREYRGNTSVTIDGFTCQAWTSQTPLLHEMTDPDLFPDQTLEEAQNFCRNPDGHPHGPWCYKMEHTASTTITAKTTCNVPYCDSINTRRIYWPLFITRATYPNRVLTIYSKDMRIHLFNTPKKVTLEQFQPLSVAIIS